MTIKTQIIVTAKTVLFAVLAFFTIQNVIASPFDAKEHTIESSPAKAATLLLKPGERVVDFDVSPLKAEAAFIVITASGQQKILFWKIGESTSEVTVPDTIKLSSLAWHPQNASFFMLATRDNRQEILKNTGKSWAPTTIFRAKLPLRKLVIGPRPFEIGYDQATQTSPTSYRLFFAVKENQDKDSIHSITENGLREYTVINSEKNKFKSASDAPEVDTQFAPNSAGTLIAPFAQPVTFHPAGHFMIWEDQQHCFHKAIYGRDDWASSAPVFQDHALCSGKMMYTPNGAAILHWKPDANGVDMLMDNGKKVTPIATKHHFLSMPLTVADGKGLVGVVHEGSLIKINYTPINIPLADVVNAWMFLESPKDRILFNKNNGLFRTLNNNQLYELYDSESYYCGNYDHATPSRPYFVTTDIFLELYASAFEGIMIFSEREMAIPAFWQFVESAHNAFKNQPDTKLAKAFSALIAVRDGAKNNVEAEKILKSKGISLSTVTGKNFDFGNLKPRSHYTMSSDLQTYFRASKYLMDLKLSKEDVIILKKMPKPVIQDAMSWINTYRPFIAAANRPLVWENATQTPPYVLHPKNKAQLFPKSWGIDNEILFSTVYHQKFPQSEQIIGSLKQPRLLPSGLDVATVLGSNMAESILEASGEFRKYPNLKPVIASLKARYKNTKAKNTETLYQKWLSTLATLWSEEGTSPGNTIEKSFWSKKRLQTGLASWATLRHASLLVNERTMSECGEAGFEPIVLRPPRGYVEPDVKTLDATSDLFDATIQVVKAQESSWVNNKPNNKQVFKGIIRRLEESRDKIRVFRDIAKKEIQGVPLTSKEYEDILYVGRAAEHNFLIFKSLAQHDFGLSTPDPIGKVADVSASPNHDFLLVGVGNPMEWDQIVPFFGRKEIVKGSVYSYYEQVTNKVLSDSEWRARLDNLAHPDWINPLISKEKLSCPAKAP